MHMEGQGPSECEDIQLVIVKAATGNPRIPQEVAARCTDSMHHV